MRNKELNLTQFETLSDEELQKIEGGYLPIPDMPGWERPIYSLVVEFEAI